MTATTRASALAALMAALIAAGQLIPATTLADPETPTDTAPVTDTAPATGDVLHNITYRARIDGVSRGATVRYKFDDTNVQTANPTMLPGRIFETTGVLADQNLAGMEVTVDWPYSANLHCEILVDDAIVAQADDFIAPRAFPVRDDPMYGTLQCGSALDIGTGPGNVVNTDPVVVDPAPPAPAG